MTVGFTYREMAAGEEQAVCDFVKQVFDEYVAPAYGRNGIDEFLRFANQNAMKERMQSGGFLLVAEQADTLVGMLEFWPPNVIAMLFVSVKQKGIATELLARTIAKLDAESSGVEKLTAHSSSYAVPVYQKLGFKIMGESITENGITYVPMELKLTDKYA